MLTPELPSLDPELTEALERIEELVDAFEADADPATQAMAQDLLQSIDLVHRAGLSRLYSLLAESNEPLLRRALADPAVQLLFELYELPPENPAAFIPLDDIDVLRDPS